MWSRTEIRVLRIHRSKAMCLLQSLIPIWNFPIFQGKGLEEPKGTYKYTEVYSVEEFCTKIQTDPKLDIQRYICKISPKIGPQPWRRERQILKKPKHTSHYLISQFACPFLFLVASCIWVQWHQHWQKSNLVDFQGQLFLRVPPDPKRNRQDRQKNRYTMHPLPALW